jgi:hypothetical protein
MVVSLQLLGELTPEALVSGHPGLYTMEQLLTGGPAFQVRGRGLLPAACCLLPACLHRWSSQLACSWPCLQHTACTVEFDCYSQLSQAPQQHLPALRPLQALLALLRGGLHELDRSDRQGEAGPARREAVQAGLRLVNMVMQRDLSFIEQTRRLQMRVRCAPCGPGCVATACRAQQLHLCAVM